MIVCWMPLMRVCLLFRPFRSLHQCSIYLHCSYCQCGVCFNERFAPPSLASSLSLSFRVALWGMPWWAVRSPISAPFFFFYFSIKSSNQPVQPTPKGFKPKLKKMNLLTSRIHTMGKGMIDTLHSSIHSNWWIVKIRGLPTSMDWCKWKSKIWRLFGMFALSSLWLKSLSQMSGFEVCWDWPSWRQIQWCLHNLGVERMATVSNAVGVKGMNWSMSSFFNAIQVLIFSKYRSNELSANWNPDRKLFFNPQFSVFADWSHRFGVATSWVHQSSFRLPSPSIWLVPHPTIHLFHILQGTVRPTDGHTPLMLLCETQCLMWIPVQKGCSNKWTSNV